MLTFGNNDSNHTNQYEGGVFIQQNVAFTPWLNIDFGGRGDLVSITTNDPVPPPGYEAARDSIVFGQGAGNASLSIKPTTFSTIYGTYNFSESSSSALGGGYALSGNSLTTPNFHIRSDLFETGVKVSLFKNTLYGSVAVYNQTRDQRNIDGSSTKIDVRGVEVEATYQPNKNFYVTTAFSYLDPHTVNGFLFQSTGSVNDEFDDSRPNIIQGTGLGSPNENGVRGPGDFSLPGFPMYQGNGTISYTLDCGIGGVLNAVVTSPFYNDIFDTVRVPTQFTIDAALFYKRKNFEARFDVFNVTDERNWSSVLRQRRGRGVLRVRRHLPGTADPLAGDVAGEVLTPEETQDARFHCCYHPRGRGCCSRAAADATPPQAAGGREPPSLAGGRGLR